MARPSQHRNPLGSAAPATVTSAPISNGREQTAGAATRRRVERRAQETSELLALDVDVLNAEAADELHALARIELGDGPSRNGQPPKDPVAYRTAVPFRKRRTRLLTIDGYSSTVELLANGQQWQERWRGRTPSLLAVVSALFEHGALTIGARLLELEACYSLRFGGDLGPDRDRKSGRLPIERRALAALSRMFPA